MADLSKLTDEQLEVYRDLLAKKQGSPTRPEPEGFGPAIGKTLSGVAKGINPFNPAAADSIMHPIEAAKSHFGEMKKLREQAGSDLSKGNFPDAIQHGLGGMVPILGPMISGGMDALIPSNGAPPDYEKAGQSLGGIIAPKILKATSSLAGKGLRATAEPIAESGAGVKWRDRGFGNNGENGVTPGSFILDQTKGYTPATVQKSAVNSLKGINSQLESVVANSPNEPSLAPARKVVDSKIQQSGGSNSKITLRQMEPIRSFLNEPEPTFTGKTDYAPGAMTPITPVPGTLNPFTGQRTPTTITPGTPPNPRVAETQPGMDFLNMKRQANKDFVGNWNPAVNTKHELRTARGVYGAMADAQHSAIPESAPLDKLAHAGVPVAEELGVRKLTASPIEKIFNRFGAHTGALTGMVAGGASHGFPGAIAGLVIPEMIANPTVQIGTARALNALGYLAKNPIVGNTVGALPRIPEREKK
jgi:hypothetical protein